MEATEELVTRERMVLILRELYWHRKKLTTADIARLVGIQWHNAYDTMLLIERLAPELCKDAEGWWVDFARQW